MNTLGMLERLLLKGIITDAEYEERKRVYTEIVLDMYCIGIISKERMLELLNN